MIRKLFLLPLSLGIISDINAQSIKHNIFRLSPEQVKNRKMIGNILNNNPQRGTAHKPTGIKQRVIAQAFMMDDDIDSTTYSYSGSNGSSFDYNNFYELAYSTEFIPDMKPAYIQSYIRPSNDVKASEMMSYGDGELYYQTSAIYNSSGKIDSVYAFDIFSDSDPFKRMGVNYTDEGNFNSAIAALSDDGTVYDYESKREITYAAPGHITGDSVFSYSGSDDWTLAEVHTYHYNSDGRPDSITIDDDVFVYAYDADGRVSKAENYMSLGGELVLFMSDSFGYTPGIDYVTYFQEIYYFGDMVEGTKILQYPGAGGRPDSLEMYDFDEDVWIKSAVATYSYNSFGNPEHVTIEGTVDGEPVSAWGRFYYEEYDDASSVDDVAQSKDFGIYPNPFRSELTINYAGKSGTAVSLKLTDITGRSVFNTSLNLQQGINRVAIPEIAPGNYIMMLQGASGKTWSTKLVRQ